MPPGALPESLCLTLLPGRVNPAMVERVLMCHYDEAIFSLLFLSSSGMGNWVLSLVIPHTGWVNVRPTSTGQRKPIHICSFPAPDWLEAQSTSMPNPKP